MKTFTCFGEVLWDLFPDDEIIGGAPLNVALRLQSFKNDVVVISAIGNDNLGNKLKDYLNSNGLTSSYIQNNNYKTGSVKVTLSSSGSASYEIEAPVAWDFIEAADNAINHVKFSDVFIFGSLVCRNDYSKKALLILLKHAKYKVFDVNLRSPFYSIQLISELMQHADFIKFNDEELDFICEKLNSNYSTVENKMIFISKAYQAETICVTLGDKGAIILKNNVFYRNHGYKVTVQDTVGSGDSFLATLLHHIINENTIDNALNFACAVGALVASKKGANPELKVKEIKTILGS